MNRELIDMDIKEAMKKVIDTLENHNTALDVVISTNIDTKKSLRKTNFSTFFA